MIGSSSAVLELASADSAEVGGGGPGLWIGAALAGLVTVVVFFTIVRIVLAGHVRLPADPVEFENAFDEADPGESDLPDVIESTGRLRHGRVVER